MAESKGAPPEEPTLAYWRESRATPGSTLFDQVHGYLYARWYYFYVALAIRTRPLVQAIVRSMSLIARAVQRVRGLDPGPRLDLLAESVHGKVIVPQAATRLVTVGETIDLRDLEQVIPYSQARDIVLRNPLSILALDCPCRASRPDPCLPMDVCLIIGEPVASLFAAHQPRRSRRISQEQAVDLLRAEHERGHVHHAFFKDAMLGRLYAICNCCACCCGPLDYWRHGTPMLASSGHVARVDLDLCTGCASCTDTCQFTAISLDTGTAVVDESRCMGCGVCVSRCEPGALSLALDLARGKPLEIRQLLPANRQ